MIAETFWELFYSIGHWEFEIFLMLLFDVIFAWAIWKPLKRYIEHRHDSDIQQTVEAEHNLHDYRNSSRDDHTRILELEQTLLELRHELALISRTKKRS